VIEIADRTITSWTADSINCDGSTSTIMTNLYCVIPMSVLTSSPYNYQFDDLVKVQVKAHNSLGFGPYSTINISGAQIRRVPDAMTTPVVIFSSDTSITISWTAQTVPINGNSNIQFYNLQWNSGSGSTFTDLSNSLTTSYTVNGLTGGSTYVFKVRSRNVYGYGSFSSTLSVITIDVPSKMGIPTVSVSGTDVKVEWTYPNDHSSTITKYEILFMKADGTFTTEITSCNGDLLAASLSCLPPMTTIISITSLTVDSLIKVKLRAFNDKGWGEYSEINTSGATIETLPF
jgi:hypothetical protein